MTVEPLRDYHRQYPKALEDVWRFGQVDRFGQVLRCLLESLR